MPPAGRQRVLGGRQGEEGLALGAAPPPSPLAHCWTAALGDQRGRRRGFPELGFKLWGHWVQNQPLLLPGWYGW